MKSAQEDTMLPAHARHLALAGLLLVLAVQPGLGRSAAPPADLDRKVQAFLEARRGTWRDLNVPEVDGRTLHDLILKHRFRRAVEIGTSTGHSGVWMAWALAKTGGRLLTLEIDPRRHTEALASFREAGLIDYIDARLGDAHEIVPSLDGPLDFVFSDADKEWYTRYFVALWPKMAPGGCFTAHNVTMQQPAMREFLDHIESVKDGRTTMDTKSSAGISITCKQGT
jgi:predicted O-methyltransferase YrrM